MRALNAGAAPVCRPSPSRFVVRTGRVVVAGSTSQDREELRNALEFEGHQVVEAESADQTLQATFSGRYHVLVLVSRFEGMEPHELCRRIRRRSDLGIIVVAGDGTRQGGIDALNAGADDFLSSPFVPQELTARVRAVLRRVRRFDEDGHQVILQDRAVDLQSHKIRGPGRRVSALTPKEFLVLQCLVAHANQAFTHQNLAQTVWQRDGRGEIEYMRVVISQLRRKLEPDPSNPRYILTERSVGYRFHLPPRDGQGAAELTSHLSLVA